MLKLTSKSNLSKNIAIEEFLASFISISNIDLLFDFFLFYENSLLRILASQNFISRILSFLNLLNVRKSRKDSLLNFLVFFSIELFNVLFDYDNFFIDFSFNLLSTKILIDFATFIIIDNSFIIIIESKSRFLYYNKKVLNSLNFKKIDNKNLNFLSREMSILFNK